MKFTDGCWLLKEGVKIDYAVEVSSYTVDSERDGAARAILACRHIRDRGDTLYGPTITMVDPRSLQAWLKEGYFCCFE